MQKLNILVLGPQVFLSSLSELKTYLKFNLNINQKNISNIPTNEFDAVIFHQKYWFDCALPRPALRSSYREQNHDFGW